MARDSKGPLTAAGLAYLQKQEEDVLEAERARREGILTPTMMASYQRMFGDTGAGLSSQQIMSKLRDPYAQGRMQGQMEKQRQEEQRQKSLGFKAGMGY